MVNQELGIFQLMKWTSILILIASYLPAQESVFQCNDGFIQFISTAPLERIEATSQELKGVVEVETGKLGFSVGIKTFQGFNSPLQREHFNENYLESDQFPRATFVGKIIEKIDFNVPGTYSVRAKGKLEIHGIQEERIIKGSLTVGDNEIRITTQFSVLLEDYHINVPRIVNQKIAEEIDVQMEAKLTVSSL